MFQLVYTSAARNLFCKADVESILSVSREKNRQHGITGVLLYRSGSIVQVLEGEEMAIRQLYSNIEKDSRHKNVTIIYTQPIEVREFSEWTMGFHSVELEMETHPDWFNPIFQANDRLAGANGRAAMLIKTFAAMTR